MTKKWIFIYSEVHSMIQNEIFLIGFTKFKKIPGMLNTVLYVNKQGWQTCYSTQEELSRIRNQGKLFLINKYRKKFDKEIKNCVKKFSQFYNYYKRIDLIGISNQRLLTIFEEYIKNLSIMFAYYQVGGGRSYPLLEENIKRKLLDYYKEEELDKIYGLILKSPLLDILEREEAHLLKLIYARNTTKQDLIAHSKSYAFRFFNTYDERDVLSALEERIKEIKKQQITLNKYVSSIRKKKANIKQSQKRIFQTIKNKELVSQINYLQEQARLRLEYKEWKNGAEYKFLRLFKEISNRMGISVKDFLFSYTIEETRAFLRNSITLSQDSVQQRKDIFILFKDNNKTKFLFGESTKKFLSNIQLENTELILELKGIPASLGYAKGIAKIIFFKSVSELLNQSKDFKKGEILITTMTQPDMVPLMQKAAAIVTDQGGMTSHAAVIAREFHIPCVVRTYEATRIFKNGDLIEVDANKGIVKKIV